MLQLPVMTDDRLAIQYAPDAVHIRLAEVTHLSSLFHTLSAHPCPPPYVVACGAAPLCVALAARSH